MRPSPGRQLRRGARRYASALAVALLAFQSIAIGVEAEEPARPEKEFFFYNGGYDYTSNYLVYEQTLRIFAEAASRSGGRATILNAGGADSKVVGYEPGTSTIARDPSGFVRFAQTPLAEKYPAADSPRIEASYREIAARKPRKTFVMVTDHGGSAGISTWYGKTLAYSKQREHERRIAENGLLIKYAMHCNSGASIVDPARGRPESAEGLLAHVRKHFPERSCGLGNSRHDQLAYLSHEHALLEAFVKTNPRASLNDFHRFARRGDFVSVSSPVLTSDYFLEDVTGFFCREYQAGRGNSTLGTLARKTGCDSRDPGWKKDVLDALTAKLCDESEWRAETQAIERELGPVASALSEIGAVKAAGYRGYMQGVFPKELAEHEAALARVEAMEAERAVLDPESERSKAIEGEIVKLRSSTVLQSVIMKESFGRGDIAGFNEYFPKKAVTPDWLQENAKHYPLTLEAVRKDGVEAALGQKREAELAERARALRAKIADRTTAQLDQRRVLGEALLEDPRFGEIKRIYGQIRKCESTPVF